MIPLAIWVLLIGYTIAWTGRMNWSLRYEPQSDGTIKVVDGDGKPSRTWSLTDAITGAPQATGSAAVGRAGADTASSVGQQPGPAGAGGILCGYPVLGGVQTIIGPCDGPIAAALKALSGGKVIRVSNPSGRPGFGFR